MPAFTPDAVRVLDPDLAGPVLEQRLAAAERFAATELPTAEEEIWRYSRIGELDLERFGPAAVDTVVTGAERVGTQLPPGGLDLFPGDAPDAFAELNAAFMSPVVLTIPKGTVVDGPITVTHTVSAGGAAVFPRLVIDAGRRQRGHRHRAVRVARRRQRTRRARAPRAGPTGVHASSTWRSTSSAPTPGRSATSRRSASATPRSCWPPSPSAATTHGCAPRRG